MAIVILGLFSSTIVGIEGPIDLSIAHGKFSPTIVNIGGETIPCAIDRAKARDRKKKYKLLYSRSKFY